MHGLCAELLCQFLTGDGFKLFRIFEKRGVATNMPESQEVPAALATDNSFFSFLPWKKKPAVLEGFLRIFNL